MTVQLSFLDIIVQKIYDAIWEPIKKYIIDAGIIRLFVEFVNEKFNYFFKLFDRFLQSYYKLTQPIIDSKIDL